jgi:hypothetical protein
VKRTIGGVLAALLLGGCAQDEGVLSMGPGSETSGLSVRLRNADGTPSIKVCVRAVDVQSWAESRARGMAVLDSQSTDDSGRAVFSALPRVRLALEAQQGSAVVHQELPAVRDSFQVLTLHNGGSIRVRLTGDVTGVRALLLRGTSQEARLQGDQSWVFPWVPQGPYTLVAWKDSTLVPLARLVVDSARTLDTVLDLRPMVLLDDFEANSVRNLIGQELGGGAWFVTGEGWQSGKSPVSIPDLAAAREPGWNGKSMHVQFQVDTSLDANYSMLGMDLAQSPDGKPQVWRNLTHADSLAFYTRGRGSLALRFLSAVSSDSCSYEVPLALSGTWHRVSVNLDTVRVVGNACPTWTEARRQVAGIGFVAHRDAELWLDDLQLYGLLPGELFSGYLW